MKKIVKCSPRLEWQNDTTWNRNILRHCTYWRILILLHLVMDYRLTSPTCQVSLGGSTFVPCHKTQDSNVLIWCRYCCRPSFKRELDAKNVKPKWSWTVNKLKPAKYLKPKSLCCFICIVFLSIHVSSRHLLHPLHVCGHISFALIHNALHLARTEGLSLVVLCCCRATEGQITDSQCQV